CVSFDNQPNANGITSYLPYSADLHQDEHNLSWRGGVNYKPTENSLIYALVSRGFQAGGFPASYLLQATQFAPAKQEQLTSYEVGMKTVQLNRALHFNASVFYYDYRD